MSTKMYAIQHGSAPRCQHIFDTNLQCQSPALRGRPFCYWHQQNRKYKEKFTVPVLETAHAIQLTLSRITADLYDGKIDTKRATALYYGLSLAMFNVRHISNPVSSDHIIDLPPAISAELVGADVPVCPSVRSTEQPAASPEDVEERTTADVCHPEGGRMPDSNHPDDADNNDDASTMPNHEPAPETWTPGASHESVHEAWKSGASAPRCEPPEYGALAPVDPAAAFRATEEHSASKPRPATFTSSLDHRTSSFIKRVLRTGPNHPKFAEVSRIYDRYISAKQAG